MRKMADAAWICGDPGMQYDTTINDWHPCINTARINASNPCSEYMFLDDSACNLASLNLREVPARADGEFDVESFRAAARRRSPRWRSSSTTRRIRPSEDRARTATRSARSASATRTSARCSCRARPAVRQRAGPRVRGGDHRAHVRRGVRDVARKIAARRDRARSPATPRTRRRSSRSCASTARAVERIDSALRAVRSHAGGARVVGRRDRDRPRSTASATARRRCSRRPARSRFLMDCDTTGIEPDIAIVKYKRLVGGGLLKIVNQTVPEALAQARLRRARGRGDRRAHRREGHDRGRAVPQGRAPAGVRLRVPRARTARARSTTWATSA